MTKKNKNKQRKQPKQKKKRGQQRQSVGNMKFDEKLAKAVCSNLNAFCPEANGAKLYDDNSQPSNTFQARGIFTMSTDTNGVGAFCITSQPQYCFSSATVVANVTTAWAAQTPNAFYNTFSSVADTYRVVSWGFRLKTSMPWTTAQGNMIVAQSNATNPINTVGQNVTSLSQGVASDYTTVRDASVEVMGKPLGMSSTSYSGFTSMPAWSTYYIYINGAPTGATTVIGTLELVVNYEWVAVSTSGFNQMSSPAAPSVPEVMTTRGNVAATRPLMDKFVDTMTSDMTWMDAVARNLGRAYNVGSVLSNFIPQARGPKMALAGATSAYRMLTNG